MFSLNLTGCLSVWWICFAAGITQQGDIPPTNFDGTTMGPIEYRVVVCDQLTDPTAIETGIGQRLEQVNQLMSTYIDSSDVSRVNNASAGQWIEVDPLTLSVVQRALEISQITDGAFDITVGPAVNLWRFGPEKELDHQPSEAEIEAVKAYVGFGNISTRSKPPGISKTNDHTQIDLSAIAKGFAVDRVAEFLIDNSLKNFMVEVGGEVITRGTRESSPWRIGIEKPVDGVREVSSVVELRDQAMATSGDYRNFVIIDGQRYSHTIDPKTCRPARNSVASCSVLALDCMTADAFATAIMVMGAEAGLKFGQDNGVAVSFIKRGGADAADLATTSSAEFPFAPEAVSIASTDTADSIWPAFVGAMIVFGLAIAGMAVGAIFNNRPITGSCGGIAATQSADGSAACSMCQKPVAACPERVSRGP